MQFIQLLVKTDTEGGLLRKAKGFFHRNFTGSWTEKYLIAELLISRYLDNWSLIASHCHWKWHSYPRNNNFIIHCYAETHSSKALHPASYHFSKSNLQQNFFQIVISSFLDTYYSKAGSRVQLSLLNQLPKTKSLPQLYPKGTHRRALLDFHKLSAHWLSLLSPTLGFDPQPSSAPCFQSKLLAVCLFNSWLHSSCRWCLSRHFLNQHLSWSLLTNRKTNKASHFDMWITENSDYLT